MLQAIVYHSDFLNSGDDNVVQYKRWERAKIKETKTQSEVENMRARVLYEFINAFKAA